MIHACCPGGRMTATLTRKRVAEIRKEMAFRNPDAIYLDGIPPV